MDCETEPEEILQAMSVLGFKLFGAVQPPGVLIPYHTHEQDEWLIVLEGCMKLIIEEEFVLVEEGEVVTISAHAVHGAVAVGEEPARILVAFKD